MLSMTCLMSLDSYTYSKCSFTNYFEDDGRNDERTEHVLGNCASCNQNQIQDEFVHAKYSLSNNEEEKSRSNKFNHNQGTSHKDACDSCLKSQCSSRKRNLYHDSNCDCLSNYVYDFSMSKVSNDVNDEKSVYFVYHISLAIYKFLLHFKFHFSICMTYSTLDRFVSRLIMLYLIQYQSSVLLIDGIGVLKY